jgi:hypothetical protein
MKTPMQELLERVKEYRDSETSPLVISRLNSVCVDIVGMLEKEEEAMCQFAEQWFVCFGYKSAEEYYNKTFNTKER